MKNARRLRLRLLAVGLCLAAPSTVRAVPLRQPVAIEVTEDRRYVIVAFRGDSSLTILDYQQTPPDPISLFDGIGRRPVRVRTFGDLAAVVHAWDRFITLVDVPSATVVEQVRVPLYCQDVVWDAERSLHYVSNAWLDRVFVLDAAWVPVPGASVAVGRQPGPMVLGPDGRLYVANRASWDVSVVDLDARREVARVDIGSRPEDVDADAASVFVTNHGGAELEREAGVPLVRDDQADIRNVLTRIDPATLATEELHVDHGADYAGLDVFGGLIAFSGAGSGTVHLQRLGEPDPPLHTVDLLGDDSGLPGGRAPSGLRIFANTRDVVVRHPDQVLAINFLRDTLVELRPTEDGGFRVFDELALNEVGEPIQAFQPEPAINFEPVQNGERYFNTLSAWRRGQRDFTCATCHTDGHSDLRTIFDADLDPFDPDRVQGPERHPSIRFAGHTAPYAWEGEQPSLFEANVAALDAHDVPPATGEVLLDVADFMAQFAGTLVAGPNPYPPPTAAGRDVFSEAGCAACHVAPTFTDGALHDVGTGRVLDTPTLLGLWDRPPYLHDGRAATIEDVLDPELYVGPDAHGDLGSLGAAERQALADYLRALRPGSF